MAATLTTEGMNHMLDVTLHNSTPVNPWYVGLVGATHVFAEGDTGAQIGGTNGWSDFTHVTSSLRLEYVEAAASSASTTNSANKAVFTIAGATGSETVNGAYLASDSSGVATVLLGEGDFTGGAKSVANADTLTVTVTVSLTDNS
jgi:hypothetical protein